MNKITTAEQFNEIIAGDKEVLVKFEAGWCLTAVVWKCSSIQSSNNTTNTHGTK